MDLILTINPGTTTTRLGLFEFQKGAAREIDERTIDHDETTMAAFKSIADQLDFRAREISRFLAEVSNGSDLVAVAGRGGMLSPVPPGAIRVNQALVDFALHTPLYHHSSNLGAPLAQRIALEHGCPAFVVDPVSVDELPQVARVSGCPDLPRFSFVHALNVRACGRRLAETLGKPFTELDAVVAHLGAGISIAALEQGRIVESSNRMEISPFSPERAGGLPPLPLIELCYSGRFTKDELTKRLYGQGGVTAYLGTKDIRRVEAMIDAGDSKARLVWEAMVYQISKAIGVMAAVLDFRPDGIILTGGIAHSTRIVSALTAKCSSLSPVHVYPGSHESEALATGAARILGGFEEARTWPVTPDVEALPW